MSPNAPARVSFPRGVWVAIALVMLGQLAGILIQLGVVSDQRKLTRQQKAIAERTLREVGPLAYDTRPLARDARRALPQARRTARHTDALVTDLDAARLPEVTQALGVLARSLVESDAAGSLRTARDVLGQMRRTDLIARTSHAAALAPRQYEIQRRTLVIQEQALAITRQTLDIAKATLAHAESLDRKTGGTAPPPAPPPAVP